MALGEEQARIDLLVAGKQAQREQTAAALSAEQERAGELAGEAKSMQSLIDSMEQEIAAAAAAAEQEQVAAREAAEEAEAEAVRTLDTRRIEPAMHFADAKGRLMLPVAGETVLDFGATDGIGDETQGMSIAARPGSPVLAPADGWVVYAGPFRSYGQVLILNAGDDYHIVMAGMERIDVALRQFVLAGEPVATMGATRLASIAEIDHTSAQPVLYVEFRKDGTAIDSGPVVGRGNGRRGQWMMMRKFAILASGAVLGAVAMGSVAEFSGGMNGATAAATDTYRQLNLFGDVFERIRADYVEEPDDAKLIESAVNGMLSSLDPHSSFLNAERLSGHAGPDARRVLRPRHRGHDGERADQGHLADRRYAGRQGRHPRRRSRQPSRRRAGAGPDAARGGRPDARPGELVDRAHRACARARTSR